MASASWAGVLPLLSRRALKDVAGPRRRDAWRLLDRVVGGSIAPCAAWQEQNPKAKAAVTPLLALTVGASAWMLDRRYSSPILLEQKGIIFDCPHEGSRNIQKGSVNEIPFAGEARNCSNCGRRCWVWEPGSKKTDSRIRYSAAGTSIVCGVGSLVFPPAATFLGPVGFVAAAGGGGYNVAMGIASEDGWRVVRGGFALAGAGLDAIGDAAAEALGHGLDAIEVALNLTEALLNEDPVSGVLCVFSAIAVGFDLHSASQASGATATASDAKKMFREAKQNTSALAKSIRAGGPQKGVKIGKETICSLRKAANARDGIEFLYKSALITAAEKQKMHEVLCTLKDAVGFVGDTADFIDELNNLKPNVHAEKR